PHSLRRRLEPHGSRALTSWPRKQVGTLRGLSIAWHIRSVIATEVVPKFVSPSDPAAQWTGALKGPAFFAYADNYLIDVRFGVIVDVEASRAIRQAEIGAARTMLERTEERFGLKPQRLAADSAYGSASMLNWLVEEKHITP